MLFEIGEEISDEIEALAGGTRWMGNGGGISRIESGGVQLDLLVSSKLASDTPKTAFDPVQSLPIIPSDCLFVSLDPPTPSFRVEHGFGGGRG